MLWMIFTNLLRENIMNAFMFDLDGTLLDTLNDIGIACNAMLDEHNFPTHPIAAYRHFVGNGFTALIRLALPKDFTKHASDDEIYKLAECAKKHYATALWQETRPYPGISETLYALKERQLSLMVLSNKPDRWTKMLISHFFPEIPFLHVQGALPDVPLKPDPQAALDILRQQNIRPKECWYVGDSNVDMMTAQKAGMIPIGVSWGFQSAKDIHDAGGTTIISNAKELLQLISSSKSVKDS